MNCTLEEILYFNVKTNAFCFEGEFRRTDFNYRQSFAFMKICI